MYKKTLIQTYVEKNQYVTTEKQLEGLQWLIIMKLYLIFQILIA